MSLLTDTKIGAGVAATATATGVAEWLRWIPNDIGKLATLVGICLSLVLIGTHITRVILEVQRTRAEIAEIKRRHPGPE